MDLDGHFATGSFAATVSLDRSKGMLFLVIGIGLLAAGLWRALVARELVRRGTRADGTVIALNAGGSHPQIRFTTATGDAIEYPQGGLIFGYRVGDKVKVVYSADDPRNTARLDTIGARLGWPILLMVLGAGFLIAGGALLRPRHS